MSELLSGSMNEKIEEAAELLAENFSDDDQAHSIHDAAQLIGVSAVTCYEWVNAHDIPSEKIGSRMYIRQSVVDIVIELRALHGRDWKSFATWGFVENDTTDTETEASEDKHDVMELADDEWARFWNLMRRAKTLYDRGNPSGAADVVFAACDEFDVL